MIKKIIKAEFTPITILIVINLVIGLLILPDYGESWDEAALYNYAERSLRAYDEMFKSFRILASFKELDPLHGDHGPALVMLITMLRRALSRMSIPPVEISHFIYFLFFQIGVISLYSLARRWMSSRAAFGTAILFSTQPLLWGHAFINPKDTPFMSLFLTSVATGLWMVDRAKNENNTPVANQKLSFFVQKTNTSTLLFSIAWLVIIFVIWVWGTNLVYILISKAYMDGPHSILGSLFERFATQAKDIPLDIYVYKGNMLFKRIKSVLAILSLLFVIHRIYYLFPDLASAILERVKHGFRNLISALSTPDVWISALVLGFSSAIRLIAPLAGLLVVLYAIVHHKRNVILRLIVYALLSCSIMILLWPYLWPAPFERLLFSILNSSSYPIDVQTLFGGKLYFSHQIPRSYLIVLLGVQFTETTLLLILCGFVSMKNKLPVDMLIFLLVWFLLPFAWFILARTPLYDNSRHVLFILPPLFLLAGKGLDWILRKISVPIYRYSIIAIAVLPALIADIKLHPYQYVYYNQLVGSLSGAYRHYQLDYWDISYREAALYLNEIAPMNAKVVPVGPYQVMQPYIRSDIKLFDSFSPVDGWNNYDYIVVSTRNNQDLDFSQYQTVYEVEREGAVLTVVKRP